MLTDEQDAARRKAFVRALDQAIADLTWIRHRMTHRRLTKVQRRAAVRRLAWTRGTLDAIAEMVRTQDGWIDHL